MVESRERLEQAGSGQSHALGGRGGGAGCAGWWWRWCWWRSPVVVVVVEDAVGGGGDAAVVKGWLADMESDSTWQTAVRVTQTAIYFVEPFTVDVELSPTHMFCGC